MAIDAFLKIDGVTGESVVDKHEGEIDVIAWSWGMTQSGTTHVGTGGGAGKVNVQDMSFVHAVDSAAPNLLQACCSGKHFKDALLVLRKAGNPPLDYCTIKMEDVLITSISTGGSNGEETLTENVTLNFARFTFSYQAQDKTGAAKGGAVEVAYDIAVNK